jgi:drug/metabolite transporter (DMT)-like permease
LGRFRATWRAVPGNHRGAIWMLLGTTGFTLNSALVKLLGAGGMHPFEIAFGRSVVALLAMLPFIWRAGPGVLRSNHLRIHFVRGLAGGTAMICSFYALTRLPLADFTALSFTTPLFIMLLAALVLGERVGPRRWGAVAVGFLGVLVMTRPGAGAFDPNALWVLVMALGIAIAVVLVKRLPPSESQITMLTYFCLISLAMSAVPAALVWRTPTVTEVLLLTSVGTLGIASQSLMIRAFRAGEASFVAPFEYSRLLFAAALGFFLFAEAPDPWSYLGAAIIVAATLYLARRGSREK